MGHLYESAKGLGCCKVQCAFARAGAALLSGKGLDKAVLHAYNVYRPTDGL